MKKRVLSAAILALASFAVLSGCSSQESASTNSETKAESEAPAKSEAGSGSVYYLNFKPEADAQWQELAKLYTEETGVPVTVLTAASGQYEATLKSEIAKTKAPTLFQVNGPVRLAAWKDYCYDLAGSAVLGELTNEDFTLKEGDKVLGLGYVIESYGIIYNKNLLEQAGYKKEDIKGFADLKKIAEDISARKDELGFTAFTSAGMDGSSDWRFKTHLANLPIYYEYKQDGITNTKEIKGSFLKNYKEVWDLYINNATVSPNLLSTKTIDDAVAEFVTEEAVFFQNGTWAYNDIAEVGNENLGMLPIYIGAEGENKQGLCTGTENFWCVNSKASQEDIDATLAFMNWCVTSDVAVKALCGGEGVMPSGQNGMGFVIPFKKNLESENPLVNIANEYVAEGFSPVSWTFSTMPSEAWKNAVGSALTVYASDQSEANWKAVETAFIDEWKKEAANLE